MRGANEDERLPRTSVVRATVGRGGAFRRVQNGGGGGGGGRGFSYSPDTVEGLRLPAVKLDAHHSSLDRIVRGGEDVGARGMVCIHKYTHIWHASHMWHLLHTCGMYDTHMACVYTRLACITHIWHPYVHVHTNTDVYMYMHARIHTTHNTHAHARTHARTHAHTHWSKELGQTCQTLWVCIRVSVYRGRERDRETERD